MFQRFWNQGMVFLRGPDPGLCVPFKGHVTCVTHTSNLISSDFIELLQDTSVKFKKYCLCVNQIVFVYNCDLNEDQTTFYKQCSAEIYNILAAVCYFEEQEM